jgi:hypothetical protein
MHVPQAEIVNFAKALCAASEETLHIIMLGTSVQRMSVSDSTIEVIPYFGNPKAISKYLSAVDDPTVLIWQGRHAIQSGAPTSPHATDNKPTLTEPFSANDFERLQCLKLWQVQCYNLLSSDVIPKTSKKFFVHTDARLPLLDLNAVDPIAVPKPLPKDIVLITQAYYHNELRVWMNKYGNAVHYPEIEIKDYLYNFSESIHLPLELLPIISHRKHKLTMSEKSESKPICQIQSLKYMDDFRLKQLKKMVDKYDGDVILMGRFGSSERGKVVEFGEHAEKILANLHGSETYAIPFHKAAKILSKYAKSIVITDARYARFGLCPNRLIEAAAVGSIPIIGDEVLVNCRLDLQQFGETLSDLGNLSVDQVLSEFIDKQLVHLASELSNFLENT